MSSRVAFETTAAPEPLPPWIGAGAMSVVGRSFPRSSAAAKVTGKAEFASDVVLPRMVHAVLVRSTIARGTVTSFDAGRARTVPGVLLALGPSDLAWPEFLPRSRPTIDAEVRFVGEEIGAIVAETEIAARRAARMVNVRYDQAPACITIEQALTAEAPVLSESGNVAKGVEVLERGDFDRAKKITEVVIDARYSTEAQHHNPLEPHGCVAAWEKGCLTLWDSNQGGYVIREWLANVFGLPVEQIRVVSRYVGGGFGSKIHPKPYHAIAVELARQLGRPVRLFMARREEFIASHHRAPTRRRVQIGATQSGKLTFISENVIGQAGPCKFLSAHAAGANGLRLYRTGAARAEIRRVLTNTQVPIPFRGPTVAEDVFCLEQAMDELAHSLNMDPVELRLRNIAEVDTLACLPYAGNELERCYRLGADAFGWRFRTPRSCVKGDKAHGVGMGAVVYDATLYEPSEAEVACERDGRISVKIGVSDIGAGADTVFAQIAAQELGLPLALVETHFGDTGATPRSIDVTNHSRTCAVVGPAVRAAACKLRQALVDVGATYLRADPALVVLNEHGISLRDVPSACVSLSAIVNVAGPIICTGKRERPPRGVFAAMFGAHFVEVEVDVRSGRVAVLRAVCAHDAGRVLNPRLATSQVQGGFLQGMGMALQEERILDSRTGVMLNATMWAYRTPGILDAPDSVRFIDAGAPDGGNSLGVKGIGEPPLIASGAAIANAIHNAVGVRIRSYPITPGKVLAALAESAL